MLKKLPVGGLDIIGLATSSALFGGLIATGQEMHGVVAIFAVTLFVARLFYGLDPK